MSLFFWFKILIQFSSWKINISRFINQIYFTDQLILNLFSKYKKVKNGSQVAMKPIFSLIHLREPLTASISSVLKTVTYVLGLLEFLFILNRYGHQIKSFLTDSKQTRCTFDCSSLLKNFLAKVGGKGIQAEPMESMNWENEMTGQEVQGNKSSQERAGTRRKVYTARTQERSLSTIIITPCKEKSQNRRKLYEKTGGNSTRCIHRTKNSACSQKVG